MQETVSVPAKWNLKSKKEKRKKVNGLTSTKRSFIFKKPTLPAMLYRQATHTKYCLLLPSKTGQVEIGQSTQKNWRGTMRANFRRCHTRSQELPKTFTEQLSSKATLQPKMCQMHLRQSHSQSRRTECV